MTPDVASRSDPRLDPARDVRVMVVEDQQLFRCVIRELLAATDGFQLSGEACSGEEALAALDEWMPELVVIDARLPGMTGLQAATALLRRRPELVVLLISANELTETVGRGPAGQSIAFVPKAKLRTSVLRDVWDRRGAAN